MKRLLVFACLVGCAPMVSSVAPASTCLLLTWPDSAERSFLPGAVRLDPANDTLLPATFTGYHLLKPVAPSDSGSWFGIMNAWWLTRNDSLVLMLDGVDAGWTVRLNRGANSLVGSYVFWADGTETKPAHISARPLDCSEFRGAGA